jgi:hypothetical protein
MAGLIAWDGEAGGPATAAPGLDPYVLTVGAVDADGAVPAWSGRGHDFAGRAKPGPGGAGRRAGRAARPRLDPSTSSPIATSTPRPTRRCGCGCGATAAGRWRPWPTASAPWRGSTFTVRLPLACGREAGEDTGADGRDHGDDTQPPRTGARRLGDPLCRCS